MAGPGYLGLEWLKQTQGMRLKGLDISPDMIALAERNAREYGLPDRVEYVCGKGSTMPFFVECVVYAPGPGTDQGTQLAYCSVSGDLIGLTLGTKVVGKRR